MNKKLIIGIITLMLLMGVVWIATAENDTVSFPPESSLQSLKEKFKDKAQNLQFQQYQVINNQHIFEYKGNKAFFTLNKNGKLIGYHDVEQPQRENKIEIDEVIHKIKEQLLIFDSSLEFSKFKVKEKYEKKIFDESDIYTYRIIFEAKNEKDVVTNVISVLTTTSGRILSYTRVDADENITNQETNITEEEAINIAKKHLEDQRKAAGFDLSKIKLKQVDGKKAIFSSVYWRIVFTVPIVNPKEDFVQDLPVYVNAITGDILKQ